MHALRARPRIEAGGRMRCNHPSSISCAGLCHGQPHNKARMLILGAPVCPSQSRLCVPDTRWPCTGLPASIFSSFPFYDSQTDSNKRKRPWARFLGEHLRGLSSLLDAVCTSWDGVGSRPWAAPPHLCSPCPSPLCLLNKVRQLHLDEDIETMGGI